MICGKCTTLGPPSRNSPRAACPPPANGPWSTAASPTTTTPSASATTKTAMSLRSFFNQQSAISNGCDLAGKRTNLLVVTPGNAITTASRFDGLDRLSNVVCSTLGKSMSGTGAIF